MSSNYAERRKKLEEAAKETRGRRWRTAGGALVAGILVGLAIGLTVHYWPDPQKATVQTVADTDSQYWLFRIATENNGNGNRNAQQAALKKIHDEKILASIAMLDTGASKQAALRITKPELLSSLAVGSESRSARYIAILKTRDQDVLRRAVQADPLRYGYCREAAIHRLTDKALLRKLATEAAQPRVRWAAVKTLDDRDVLLKYIVSPSQLDGGEEWRVHQRIRRFAREGDVQALASIALHADSKQRRCGAVTKINDPAILATVLRKRPELALADSYILRKVTDHPTLAWFAQHEKNPNKREALIRRLTDPVVLAKLVAASDEREGLTHRLTDPTVLAKQVTASDERILDRPTAEQTVLMGIALKRQWRRVVWNMTDIEQLKKMLDSEKAKKKNGPWFGSAIRDRLRLLESEERVRRGDQPPSELLKSKNSRIQAIAVEKIHDQQELIQLAMFDPRRAVREAASRKVTDPKIRVKIILSDEASSVRRAALEKISDRALLMRIVQDGGWGARMAAAEKLAAQNDQEALSTILSHRIQGASRVAVKHVASQRRLALVACWKDQDLAEEALSRLSDQKHLEYVMNRPSIGYMRVLAARKITDPQRADRQARKYSDDYQVVEALIPHMTDREMLMGIATQNIRLGGAEARLAQLDRANATGR